MESFVIEENTEGASFTEIVNLDAIYKCRYYEPYEGKESRIVVYFTGITDVVKHDVPWGMLAKSSDTLEHSNHEVFWGEVADRLWERIMLSKDIGKINQVSS